MTVKPLRPYQITSINMIFEALRMGQKPVLSLPCGGGKTRIASEIFAMGRKHGKRVGFCVPYISLIGQTYRAFLDAGLSEEEMSVIQADHPMTDYRKEIQIMSVETLNRRKLLPDLDLVIFDEVHRQSKLYARWMQESPDTKWLGVSATPWAKGMGDIWDRMLIPTSTRELIDQGYLVPFNYFAPSSPDLSGVKIRAGDYAEDQLAKAMNKTTLVADIVKTWLEKAERRPTFLFAVDCAHAKHIQQQFLDAGVRAEYVDAYTPVEDREKILEKLSTGEIEIVCNIATMTTGVDCPNVSCVVLARPTKSEMLFLQMCGRGLRIASGKQNCIFLDHSDTGLNLGLPDEIVYEDFRRAKADEPDEKQERKEPLPKKCGACGYLKPAKVHQCPACGFMPEAKPNVLHCDGELEELGAGGKRHKSKATRDEKQEFWSELLYLANERGYKRGWASNKYREKFDVWPQGLHDQMAYPKATTRSWLKSRQIAWAKAREKMEKAG